MLAIATTSASSWAGTTAASPRTPVAANGTSVRGTPGEVVGRGGIDPVAHHRDRARRPHSLDDLGLVLRPQLRADPEKAAWAARAAALRSLSPVIAVVAAGSNRPVAARFRLRRHTVRRQRRTSLGRGPLRTR